eukprot:3884213-Amphidinium_carterae.1
MMFKAKPASQTVRCLPLSKFKAMASGVPGEDAWPEDVLVGLAKEVLLMPAGSSFTSVFKAFCVVEVSERVDERWS